MPASVQPPKRMYDEPGFTRKWFSPGASETSSTAGV